jgi:hypothetical protein
LLGIDRRKSASKASVRVVVPVKNFEPDSNASTMEVSGKDLARQQWKSHQRDKHGKGQHQAARGKRTGPKPQALGDNYDR